MYVLYAINVFASVFASQLSVYLFALMRALCVYSIVQCIVKCQCVDIRMCCVCSGTALFGFFVVAKINIECVSITSAYRRI